MEKLTLESTFKNGKYAGKSVADLVNISGEIFSLIKEGYIFDDEVLAAAHIKKSVRNVESHCVIGGINADKSFKPLPMETASMKQILSEINTLDNNTNKYKENESEDNYDSSSGEITINNFYEEDE